MKNKKLIITLSVILLIIALAVGGCAIYLSDCYMADNEAMEAFSPMKDIAFHTMEGGALVCGDTSAEVGFIFYPGGKVDFNAYKPLMAALAEEGVLCVLVPMPFNLAVFDINAADGIRECYPDVDRWYIGGHSLGGSMAAAYLEGNADDFCGLVLLASYSTADLSGTELSVLSVYGSADGVMNREKYSENLKNLPDDLSERVIDGANHAGFGVYGEQAGDGVSALAPSQQITLTADIIADFFGAVNLGE
ncbi:MAG: hypothetical protein J6L90_06385 [Clostridia bacterium]|nr:hypothetical protein [Clostridia bacterium]